MFDGILNVYHNSLNKNTIHNDSIKYFKTKNIKKQSIKCFYNCTDTICDFSNCEEKINDIHFYNEQNKKNTLTFINHIKQKEGNDKIDGYYIKYKKEYHVFKLKRKDSKGDLTTAFINLDD
jgi:hypothetical protein